MYDHKRINEISMVKINAFLLHLSTNMWFDRVPVEADGWWENPVQACVPDTHIQWEYLAAKPHLRFHERTYRDLTAVMKKSGVNMLVIDLGDAVRYQSHPEIAVKKAWSTDKLRRELTRLRGMGIEPIPKLNLSTRHNVWLGKYRRQVSTPVYDRVIRDLLEEIIVLFNTPRFFHIGMDEEELKYFTHYEYAAARQFDLWWHDLLLYVREIEKRGVRAWVWSDYLWDHEKDFLKRMPKSVVQSNWYYEKYFSEAQFRELPKNHPNKKKWQRQVACYRLLEKADYDQLPCVSCFSGYNNVPRTHDFCRKNISGKRLLGFLNAPWAFTLPEFEPYLNRSIEISQEAF